MPFAQIEIQSAFDSLLESFSKLQKRLLNLLEASEIRDRGFNRPGDEFIVIGAQYGWTDLDGEALVLQRDILKEWATLREYVISLIKDMPNSVSCEIEEACKTIDFLVKQEDSVWSDNKRQLEDDAVKAANDIILGLRKFSGEQVRSVILIPDTNALLWQPNFIEYYLPDKMVELILVPAVLSELDHAKIIKNESVGKKAEKIIRQIKEFRRRGNLNNGVTVVKGMINIRSIAVEPKISDSLSWFDPNNKDDRIFEGNLQFRGPAKADFKQSSGWY